MTKGERAFWFPLDRAVRGKYRIFLKVRLADVVVAEVPIEEQREWFLKIMRFHLDYVICDAQTTPLLVVELDDHSHGSAMSRNRDEFKDAVLAAAGLPIYRVPVQDAYDPAELAKEIDRLIAQSAGALR